MKTIEAILGASGGNGPLIPLSGRIDRSKACVFLIPGFFTEIMGIRYGPVAVSSASAEIPWARCFAPLLRYIPANVFLVNWPSSPLLASLQSLEKLWPKSAARLALGTLEKLWPKNIAARLAMGTVAFSFAAPIAASLPLTSLARSVWLAAAENADKVAGELSDLLAPLEQPYILVGHSLGGRIALRICEEIGSTSAERLPRAIALAPAVSASELRWQAFERYTPNDLEVLFSRHDRILRVPFRVGQGSLEAAVGLVGVPKEYTRNMACVDVTHRRYRKGRGHTDYEHDLLFLLDESRLWTTMFPGLVAAPNPA